MTKPLNKQHRDPGIKSRQNLGQALLNILGALPSGANEVTLRAGVVDAGLATDVDFDMVVRDYVNAGWLVRQGGKLYSRGVR